MEKVIDRIATCIDNNEIEKAKEQVKEGKKMLSERQKLIKIADREEEG